MEDTSNISLILALIAVLIGWIVDHEVLKSRIQDLEDYINRQEMDDYELRSLEEQEINDYSTS